MSVARLPSSWVPSLLAVAVLLRAGLAAGEAGGDARIERLHDEALEAYSNMEMDEAVEILDRALEVAEREGVRGDLLARLQVTYGTVLILGQGMLAAGREHLVLAARESDTVEPDRMLSAPLLEQVWQDVVAEVRPARPPGPPEGEGGEPPPEGDEPPRTFGRPQIIHDPVREQYPDHAVPIYAELQGVTGVRRVLLAYRGPGMAGWLSVDMEEHEDGYAARVPCHRVREPSIDYFITVSTDGGGTIEGGGSRESPFRVEVRDELEGRPPTLPGGPPEPPCSDDEPRPRETPLDQRDRLFYVEAQLGTGAGVPFGEELRTCEAGSDLVRISPSPAWTELVVLPELGFYINRHVALGVRARLGAPGAIFPDAPFEWAVMARARWFVIPEDPIRVFAHLGGGYGTVAHRVELQVTDESQPVCGNVHYQVAGVGVISLGAGLFYDIVRNFAIGADFTFSFFLPDFALQGDLALALNVSF